jgi:hypothetical protein
MCREILASEEETSENIVARFPIIRTAVAGVARRIAPRLW